MKRYIIAIREFKSATGILEKLSIEDFKVIIKQVFALSDEKIKDKWEWINIVNDYFQKKYNKLPTINLSEGIDFSSLEYHLHLIKVALNEKETRK